MARVPAHILRDLLEAGAATFAHGGEARAAMEAPFLERRLIPDLLEMRSARALGDDADFYIQRRGNADRVGMPLPRELRDEWEALPEVETRLEYGDARPPRAWGRINPEHHFGVRVKRPDILPAELAFRLMQAIYKHRQRQFAANAHGTTKLVNLPLREMIRLYDYMMPPPQPQRLVKARSRDAAKYGLAEMDLRQALEAILREGA